MAGNFLAEESVEAPARVLAISGELDAAVSSAFKDRLLATAEHGDHLILDLSGVEYIDSRVVAVLFGARKDGALARGRFVIVCQGEIRRMFEFTGLDIAFDVVESRTEALSQLVALT